MLLEFVVVAVETQKEISVMHALQFSKIQYNNLNSLNVLSVQLLPLLKILNIYIFV